MQTHVKVLGVLYLAVSAIFLVLALFLIMATGTAAGIVGAAAEPEDAAVAIPIIGIAGTAAAMFLGVFALPGLVTGYGLLQRKPWARIVGIVLSADQPDQHPDRDHHRHLWAVGPVEQGDGAPVRRSPRGSPRRLKRPLVLYIRLLSPRRHGGMRRRLRSGPARSGCAAGRSCAGRDHLAHSRRELRCSRNSPAGAPVSVRPWCSRLHRPTRPPPTP